MGKAKKWLNEERAALARAWVEASEDTGEKMVKGTGQTADAFEKKIIKNLEALAPDFNEDDTVAGRYHNRAQSALMGQLKDGVHRECKKFNKCLLKIEASRPSGVGDQEKINCAVAMMQGKCDGWAYRHKDYQPHRWEFYLSWLVLKNHPAFLPPKPPAGGPEELSSDSSDEDEDEEDEPVTVPVQVSGTTTEAPDDSSVSSTSATANATATGTAQPPKKKKAKKGSGVTASTARPSRGPGGGRNSTKAKTADEEAKAARKETMKEMLKLQQEKSEQFQAYVDNQAHLGAFQMAAMGYNAFKNDPSEAEEAQRYKRIMQDIMAEQNNVPASASAMPGLPGTGV